MKATWLMAIAVGLYAGEARAEFIYLNPCVGGCTVQGTGSGGASDARTHETPTAPSGTYVISEYENQYGQTISSGMGRCNGGLTPGEVCTGGTGCAGGTCSTATREWEAVKQCLREVYSPYGVTLTDRLADIPSNAAYTELIIAGKATELGFQQELLGVAPSSHACTALDNTIGFAFANEYEFASATRAIDICSAAAFESGRIFGLDYEDVCTDVMSDRFDCGGQKFFRDEAAVCSLGHCSCGPTQNTHQRLLSLFGPGHSIIAPPSATILFPQPGATLAAGGVVHVSAGAKRGVTRVELSVNGKIAAHAPGAPFGSDGQPAPALYTLTFQGGFSADSLELVAIAHDDLGTATESAPVTVANGSPVDEPPQPPEPQDDSSGCATSNSASLLLALAALALPLTRGRARPGRE